MIPVPIVGPLMRAILFTCTRGRRGVQHSVRCARASPSFGCLEQEPSDADSGVRITRRGSRDTNITCAVDNRKIGLRQGARHRICGVRVVQQPFRSDLHAPPSSARRVCTRCAPPQHSFQALMHPLMRAILFTCTRGERGVQHSLRCARASVVWMSRAVRRGQWNSNMER